MKKLICIVLLILIASIIHGCFFDIDQPQIRVNMKQDVMSDNGISAAVSGDRIYYVSNEEKTYPPCNAAYVGRGVRACVHPGCV